MMMIDTKNGGFSIGEKLKFTPNTTLSQAKLLSSTESWNVGNGFKWLYFKEIEFDLIFGISLCFFGEKLEYVDIYFRNKNDEPITWDNWTEATVLAEKENFERWLTEKIGTERKFSWGKIEAYYSLKSGSSGIGIRYSHCGKKIIE